MAELASILEGLRGAWRFLTTVLSANRDYPFHDYAHFDETNSPTSYPVGQNQVDAGGLQQKHFTSKSTLVFCSEAIDLRFNSANNAVVHILADTWYEFKCNINVVFVPAVTDTKDLYLYFEGVLPAEARQPE